MSRDEVARPEALDISRFGETLSSEVVTPGEVQAIIDQARFVLNSTQVLSKVNGVEAYVSEASAVTKNGDKRYLARIFEYTPKGMKSIGRQDELPVFGMAFDEDESLEVMTVNPRAVIFSKDALGSPTITLDSGLYPRVNDPEDVEKVKEAVRKIEAKSRLTISQRVESKRLEELKKRNARAARISRAGHIAGKYSMYALKGVAAFGLVGGVFTAGRAILNVEGEVDFDDDPTIQIPTGGAVVELGADPTFPEFRAELIGDEKLSQDSVPIEGSDQSGTVGTGDKISQVIIGSSKDGLNCVDVPVSDRTSLDSHVLAWTDFVDPDGKSRANELTVEYDVADIKFCFVGQEVDDQDNPRVLFKLIDNQEELVAPESEQK